MKTLFSQKKYINGVFYNVTSYNEFGIWNVSKTLSSLDDRDEF